MLKQACLLPFICLSLLLSQSMELRAQNQAEMNQEAGEALAAADRQLNKVYRQLVAKHEEDEKFVSELKEAQRAWLKFVEFHLKNLFPLQAGENPRVVYGS